MDKNNTSSGEHPEIHKTGANEIGSPLSTTGKHGADKQLTGNDDGIDMRPGEAKADHDSIKTGISRTDDEADSQSFDGNQDPDANKTQQP